ncbi:TonB-dependent receptor [Granulicella mallensis]|uniref:PEGA domain protein n=1 Tax=Granulicella mallensis (strain ATCC BAA-1857 / DSM 23137 / MP5ACTX8) TaxID=682795 RepID=G8NQ12_GRAMM|nr:carboxypeptidase regulatory-like domain-containing protein [Granulicella mallensis]AEU38346.1 PEGA domain protein [Granulicella mallensis MP5ACTX8]
MRRILCGILLFCSGTFTLAAQAPQQVAVASLAVSSKTMGTLSGTVADPTGAVIPGAAIHVEQHRSTNSKIPNVVSDAVGNYSIALPPGTYDITVVADGFTPFRSAVTISRAGSVTHLNAELVIATESEQVSVFANQNSTSADGNKSAMVFGEAELATMSDDDATFQEQIEAMAGSNPSLPGSVYVDGFSGGAIPPKDSIREIRINQNPYSAQYGEIGFGRVEVFTKPGSDKIHGQVMAFSTDNAFNTRNPITGTQPPYYTLTLRGNVSGPIGKKTSFFVDGVYNKQQNNSVINAAATPTSDSPFVTAIASPTVNGDITIRLDRQVTANNILTGRYEVNHVALTNGLTAPFTNFNAPAPVAVQQTLQTQAFNSSATTQTLQLSDTQNIGKNKILETRFQYIRARNGQTPVSTDPTLVVQGYFNGGGSAAQSSRDSTDRTEFQEYFSMQHGAHFIRLGGRYRTIRDANYSNAGYNGQYTYTPGTNNTITALDNFHSGTLSQFNITTGTPSAVVFTGDLGIYAEDEWKIRKNVTLNYGFRAESQSAIPDHFDPAPRVGVAWAIGQTDKKPPIVTLRSGFGLFYDRFQYSNILTAIRQQTGTLQQSYVFNNPPSACITDPVPSCAGGAAQQPTLYRIDPHLRSEYDVIDGISADRDIGKIGSVSLNYLHIQSDRQWISRNINAPLPGTFIYGQPDSGVRPLGGTQNIYQFSSNGSTVNNLVFGNAQLHPTKKINIFAFTGYFKRNSDTGGATSFPTNQYHLAADYGRAASPTFQVFVGGNFNLPFGVDLGVLAAYFNRQPFNITTGTDLNGDSQFNDRPSFATAASPAASVYKTAFGTFNANPQPGETIIPINYGKGPRFVYTGLRLDKSFHFGKAPAAPPAPPAKPGPDGKLPPPPPPPPKPYALKFRAEADNVLNHTNYGPPVGTLGPQFGESLSLNNAFGGSPNANRLIYFATIFTF